jgi:SAM-dependent methyltransferase
VKLCLACAKTFAAAGWRCPSCGHEPPCNGFLSFAPELAASDAHFEPTAFGQLEEAESQSFWFRSRNDVIVWALRTYFPESSSFLEIGCGTGFVLQGIRAALPALDLSAGELAYAGLEIAAARVPDADLYQMDATGLPFVSEFDVVGAFDVLEHLDDDVAALRSFRRAVRPGGGVVLTVPQHPSLWSAADEYGRHRRRYTRSELRAKLVAAGLAIERMTSVVTLLLPLMAASRWRQRRSPADFDPDAEFGLAAPIDYAFERVMRAERWLIERGVSLPVGGSLLAITRTAES